MKTHKGYSETIHTSQASKRLSRKLKRILNHRTRGETVSDFYHTAIKIWSVRSCS